MCHKRSSRRVSWLGLTIRGHVDFDVLFERLYPSLYRYLHRLTGDADTAEDVAQEAFVRLLRHRLPAEEARPWLFTVAMNLVRDGARKVGRRERLLAKAPVLLSSSPRPDEVFERAERARAVREVLDRLSPRDRQLLLLREEGFKYEEIAEAIGVAPSSVGTLVARALRRFVEAYHAQEGSDDPRE